MTYPVEFCIDLGPINTGLTLTATIKTMAGAAFASGVSGWTEDPAASGVYWGSYALFADLTSYRVEWFSGATFVAAAPVSPLISIVTVVAAHTFDLAQLGAVVAPLLAGYLSGAPITLTSPVALSGDVEIVRGDDYANADGRALEWTNAAGTWPDLTGATITFTARLWDAVLTKTGSVLVPTGAGQKVRVELTKVNTAIALGTYQFDIQATLLTNLRVITLVQGTLTVTGDQTLT